MNNEYLNQYLIINDIVFKLKLKADGVSLLSKITSFFHQRSSTEVMRRKYNIYSYRFSFFWNGNLMVKTSNWLDFVLLAVVE